MEVHYLCIINHVTLVCLWYGDTLNQPHLCVQVRRCYVVTESLLFVFVQADNGEEELVPPEVDGQFVFQAKDNLPPGGFKFC